MQYFNHLSEKENRTHISFETFKIKSEKSGHINSWSCPLVASKDLKTFASRPRPSASSQNLEIVETFEIWSRPVSIPTPKTLSNKAPLSTRWFRDSELFCAKFAKCRGWCIPYNRQYVCYFVLKLQAKWRRVLGSPCWSWEKVRIVVHSTHILSSMQNDSHKH